MRIKLQMSWFLITPSFNRIILPLDIENISDKARVQKRKQKQPKDLNGHQHSFGTVPAGVQPAPTVPQRAGDAHSGLLLDSVLCWGLGDEFLSLSGQSYCIRFHSPWAQSLPCTQSWGFTTWDTVVYVHFIFAMSLSWEPLNALGLSRGHLRPVALCLVRGGVFQWACGNEAARGRFLWSLRSCQRGKLDSGGEIKAGDVTGGTEAFWKAHVS